MTQPTQLKSISLEYVRISKEIVNIKKRIENACAVCVDDRRIYRESL